MFEELPFRTIEAITGPYDEEEYKLIFRLTTKRFTVQPSPKVIAMYLGADGKRALQTVTVISVGFDDGSLTFKNARSEIVIITKADQLFFYDWAGAGGASTDDGSTLRTTLQRLTSQQQEANRVQQEHVDVMRLTQVEQAKATAAQVALQEQQLAQTEREKAVRTYINTHPPSDAEAAHRELDHLRRRHEEVSSFHSATAIL